jgi:hypothetical protein
MGILLYQIGIFIAIQLSTFYGGKSTRNVAIILITIFTLLQVFTSQLMILQFITIFISYLVSKNILGKSNGKIIDSLIEEVDDFVSGDYNTNLKTSYNPEKIKKTNISNSNKKKELNDRQDKDEVNNSVDIILYNSLGIVLTDDVNKNVSNEDMNKYQGFLKKNENFIKQYGKEEFIILKMEILNSYSLVNLFKRLQNKYFPPSNLIIKAIEEVYYIKEKNIITVPTAEKYEKKMDYLHIGCMIALEHWTFNLLPYQNENTAVKNFGSVKETGFIYMQSIMQEIIDECNKLDEEYRNSL